MADTVALLSLAALDSARPLTGERLVAEVDGHIVAAISLRDGRTIADPFVPSAAAVEMLRVRTALPARRRRPVPPSAASAAGCAPAWPDARRGAAGTCPAAPVGLRREPDLGEAGRARVAPPR